jgi:hypothetical protein
MRFWPQMTEIVASHNLKVAGANPAPATLQWSQLRALFVLRGVPRLSSDVARNPGWAVRGIASPSPCRPVGSDDRAHLGGMDRKGAAYTRDTMYVSPASSR